MLDILLAFILGIVQGLTEFLPVSSSGHIELGKVLLGMEELGADFSVIVHFATVLSTLIIFRQQIIDIIKGLLEFKWNAATKFTANILITLIPIAIVFITLKDTVESLFNGSIVFVGCMLLLTGVLLLVTTLQHKNDKSIGPKHAFIIGIAQALAVLPGISRSGATIATGLLLGNKKDEMASFSFLMVIPPIVGATLIETIDLIKEPAAAHSSYASLIAGFTGAFIFGLLACQLMIKIVKKGKIQYFAYYCFTVGALAIVSGLVF